MLHVDEQTAVPGFGGGSGEGDLVGNSIQRIGGGARNVVAGARNEGRGGRGVAQELGDQFALAEDV